MYDAGCGNDGETEKMSQKKRGADCVTYIHTYIHIKIAFFLNSVQVLLSTRHKTKYLYA